MAEKAHGGGLDKAKAAGGSHGGGHGGSTPNVEVGQMTEKALDATSWAAEFGLPIKDVGSALWAKLAGKAGHGATIKGAWMNGVYNATIVVFGVEMVKIVLAKAFG